MVSRLLVMIVLVLALVAGRTVEAGDDTLRLGVFPVGDPVPLQRVMETLGQWLEQRTGHGVEVVVARDYDDLLAGLDSYLDLAWVNTASYVRLTHELPGIHYVATCLELDPAIHKAVPTYRSYIVTMKDSGVEDLSQARGKRFAFTSTTSTGGYMYPYLMLRHMGINPRRYFGKVFFLNRSERVGKSLLAGSVDLGVMAQGAYALALKNNGDRFRVLGQTWPIPLDAVVAAPSMPSDTVRAVARALAAMKPDNPFCVQSENIMERLIRGFTILDDSFYDQARRVLRQ